MNKIGVAMLACILSVSAQAETITVAVANNFFQPMKTLVAQYNKSHDVTINISTGSTGQLAAQIMNGAPFDLFFAADQVRPKMLADKAFADAPTTYVRGVLVLWSPQKDLVDDNGKVLSSDGYQHIAVADPKLAPYGLAAQQAMQYYKVYQAVEPKIVFSKGVGAAYQFVDSGNAELGFLALSQVFLNGEVKSGSYWMVPQESYAPIMQDAVVIKSSQHSAAAKAFLDYILSSDGQTITHQFGYLPASASS